LLEYAILSQLAMEPTHGYEVLQRIRALPGMDVTESAVYPILSRNAADGLLRVRQEPSPNGPPRRCYSLTPLGRTRLIQMRHFMRDIAQAVEALNAPGSEDPSGTRDKKS